MSWARFDDRYHDNRKVKRAWRRHGKAVGLHAMSVTYCAMHETDGVVDAEWIEEKLPSRKEREAVLEVLVEVGLFVAKNDGDFEVKDYLEFNHSRAEAEAQREAKATRQRKWRETQRRPSRDASTDASTGRHGVAAPETVPRPDPTRPDPIPPSPPRGNRTRDLHKWEDQAVAYAESVGVTGPRENVLRAVKGAVSYAGVETPDGFREFARQSFPSLNVVASLPDERSAA
jgi:hypothetical protein